jgi:dinuclear metal center YbgI/SA1388 family protein
VSTNGRLADLTAYLDSYLRVREIPDEPNAYNGLQVENSGRIQRIVAAVDASQQTIDGITAGSLLVVHHGLLWDGNPRVMGRHYRRLRALLDRDIAVYAAHIPLDVHPEVGNNYLLAGALGLSDQSWFGNYRGIALGVVGKTSFPSRTALLAEVERAVGAASGSTRLIPGGPERPHQVGVVTGSGGSMMAAARDAGCDTLVSGEGAAHTYFDAMEWGLNLVYAGHYATETLGVRALSAHLASRFGLSWEFHDHPTGM